jgi:outer membrane protein assembly factor BamB
MRKLILPVALAFVILCPAFSQDKNWTHFRGSNLNGISATSGIPLKWDESSIRWKAEIHGKGHSSPVVYDNQVWITTGTPDGKELYAVCTDIETGKIIYDIKLFTAEKVEGEALDKYICKSDTMHRKGPCLRTFRQSRDSLP